MVVHHELYTKCEKTGFFYISVYATNLSLFRLNWTVFFSWTIILSYFDQIGLTYAQFEVEKVYYPCLHVFHSCLSEQAMEYKMASLEYWSFQNWLPMMSTRRRRYEYFVCFFLTLCYNFFATESTITQWNQCSSVQDHLLHSHWLTKRHKHMYMFANEMCSTLWINNHGGALDSLYIHMTSRWDFGQFSWFIAVTIAFDGHVFALAGGYLTSQTDAVGGKIIGVGRRVYEFHIQVVTTTFAADSEIVTSHSLQLNSKSISHEKKEHPSGRKIQIHEVVDDGKNDQEAIACDGDIFVDHVECVERGLNQQVSRIHTCSQRAIAYELRFRVSISLHRQKYASYCKAVSDRSRKISARYISTPGEVTHTP